MTAPTTTTTTVVAERLAALVELGEVVAVGADHVAHPVGGGDHVLGLRAAHRAELGGALAVRVGAVEPHHRLRAPPALEHPQLAPEPPRDRLARARLRVLPVDVVQREVRDGRYRARPEARAQVRAERLER